MIQRVYSAAFGEEEEFWQRLLETEEVLTVGKNDEVFRDHLQGRSAAYDIPVLEPYVLHLTSRV